MTRQPDNNKLVFTLDEALSEIAALRQQNRELLKAMEDNVKFMGKIANEFHNGYLCGTPLDKVPGVKCIATDLRNVANEMVEIYKPFHEAIKKAKGGAK